jgi:hypothetical protein
MKPKRKMINLAFYTIILLIIPFFLRAQITFERYYGLSNTYASGRSVFQKADGGYVFAGAMNYEFYLVRTDSLGDTLWTRIYPGNRWDHGYSMDTTSDDGYIMAGATKSFGVDSIDIYVIRTDSLGDTLWTRTYGGLYEERGYSIKRTPDGGFIIAGRTNSFGAGGFDAYLIRIDSLGDTLWTRTYGDSMEDYATCVVIAPDDNFVITGITRIPSVRVLLTKVDTLGNVIWTKTYGPSGSYAHSIGNTMDGGFIITGQTPAPFVLRDVYLLKTDSLGDSLWSKNIGLRYGSSDERHVGYSVEQTVDGGYIIAGDARIDGVSDYDLFLIKTNSTGDTLWTRLYGGALNSDFGYSVRETSDGGYIISGRNGASGHGQAYLVKTDDQGNVAVRETPYRRQITKSYLTCSPNPFSYSTTISFSVPIDNDMNARMGIYDATGRLVRDFPQQRLGFANGLKVTWDGRNGYGNRVSSGIYFVVLQVNDSRFSEKLILVQ